MTAIAARPSTTKFWTRSLKGRLGPLLGDLESNRQPTAREEMGVVRPNAQCEICTYTAPFPTFCCLHLCALLNVTGKRAMFFCFSPGGIENAQYLDLCTS